MDNSKKAKWYGLAAVLWFVVAVFQIADGTWFIGVLFFGAAVWFMYAAAKYKKTAENKDRTEERNDEN